MNYKSTISQPASISDMSFEDYNKRQSYEISAERNTERALSAKPAGNFIHNGISWEPQEYEGFAVVSMLSENGGNDGLTKRLIEIQKELHYNLSPNNVFYYLPAESFHQTVANTLSADRFKQHILHAGLEDTYPSIVNTAFLQIAPSSETEPLRMRMMGLSIFGTAIGMLGVFENEEDYNRITRFRAGFYSNIELAKLDIRMPRPFIGHITLAYVEQSLNKNQKDHLAMAINEVNEAIDGDELYFNLTNTGLRRYHH